MAAGGPVLFIALQCPTGAFALRPGGATSALVGPGTRAPAVLKRPLRPGPLRLLTAPHGRSPFTSGPGRGPRCFHDDAACVFPLERSLTWPQVLRCAARPPPSLSGDGAGARAPPLASLGCGSRGAAPALPDEDTACVPMSGGVACPSRGDRFSMAGASPRPGSSPRLAAAWKVRGEPRRAGRQAAGCKGQGRDIYLNCLPVDTSDTGV